MQGLPINSISLAASRHDQRNTHGQPLLSLPRKLDAKDQQEHEEELNKDIPQYPDKEDLG